MSNGRSANYVLITSSVPREDYHCTRKLHAQKKYLGINFQKCVMTFRVIDYT